MKEFTRVHQNGRMPIHETFCSAWGFTRWNSQIFFFENFGIVRPEIDFLALCLGKQGPPCETIDRDLHFAPVVGPI